MRPFVTLAVIAIFLTLAAITGCNGDLGTTVPQTEGRLITNDDPGFGGDQGRALWLYEEIFIDPTTFQYEVVTQRNIAGHWNIRTWLENGPCTNCFKITSFVPSGNGTALVDIQIKHPFLTPFFTGFDVRGIAIFNGSHSFPSFGLTAPDRTKGDGELLNPDGYTTLYNSSTVGKGPGGLQGYSKGKYATPTAPSATLNGYKRFVSPGASNTRNAFFAGDSVTVTYSVDMPDTPFVLGYAVDANWASPTKKPVTNPMTDFPPEANAPEPWKVSITETPVGDGLTNEGGTTILNIDVYSLYNSVFDIEVECPELFDGIINGDDPVGSGSGYYSYQIEVENQKLAGVGNYKALISVGNDVDPPTPDWIDLVTYQVYPLSVSLAGGQKFDPIAIAGANPLEQAINQNVAFFDNGSNDPDGGAIVLYEWDFDNDGTYDAQGSAVNHSWSTPGIYSVQFRVTDNEGATDTLDTPLQITIVDNPSSPPVAIAGANPLEQQVGQNVNFFDNGSNDPDGGSIVKYEWDFDNNGTWDATGANVNHSWSSPGIYQVQFRVTDDENQTDTLDTALQITITSVPTNPPVAMASANPTTQDQGVDISFSDNGSYDPDGGSITKYEWDWENDGTWDQTGANVQHAYANPGTYFVQMRVTDDENQTDTLDVPIEITVNPVTQKVTWDNTIGPMLAQNCKPCHITSSSGGKNYSTYANFVASKVVDLANPPNSKIYKKIKNHDHFGDLTNDQLAVLLAWIADGIPEK